MYIFLFILIIVIYLFLNRHKNTEYFDPNYAKLYDITFDNLNLFKNDARLVKKYMKKNPYILDAGCGVGRHYQYFKSYPIIGVDKSENILKYAKIRNPSGKFILGDYQNSKLFGPSKFSHIMCLLDSLYHNENIDQILTNFYYWLNSDGILFLHIFDRNKLDPTPREFSQYYKKNGSKHSLTYFTNYIHDAYWKNVDDEKVKYIEKFISKNGKIKNKITILYIPVDKNIILKKLENNGFKLINIFDLKNVDVEDISLYVFKKIKFDNNIIKYE